MERYLSYLKDYNPIFIGVICNLPVLDEREKNRGDRPIGFARSQLEEGIHNNRPYNFTIDNTNLSANENAKTICEKVFK
ncbi:MAG: hypothetical protein J0H68_03415 [Sphingobacteriia bacterium]|nr:hypothetical protein [Sphingobacteriia bacterium]